MAQSLLAFVAVSLLITMVPGADMALITRQVIVGGTSLAHRTILGNLCGIVVHGVGATVGLSALLVASAVAYNVVKIAGAAYLIFLGIQSLRAARRAAQSRQVAAKATPTPPAIPSKRTALLQGFISTVLNPKPALLFLTLIPQFVDPDNAVWVQVLGLTAIHITIGAIWLTLYASIVGRAARALTRPRIRATIEAITGSVLIALGLRVAIDSR